MMRARSRHAAEGVATTSIGKPLVLALFVVAAINLKLTYFARPNPGMGFIYSLDKLVGPRSVIPLYELLAFTALFSYVRRHVARWSVAYVLPGLVFALFMVEGRFFETDGAVDFFAHEKFFAILCLIAFLGYAPLHYAAFLALDHLVDGWQASWHRTDKPSDASGLRGVFLRHTFLVTFCLLLLVSVPTIYLNYPGAFMWDTVSQVEQALKTASFHNYSGLDPQSFLYNKHPVLHTLLIRLCLNVGRAVFHSDNIGLFCFTMIQVVVVLGSISLACTVLVHDMGAKPSVVLAMLAVYVLHPRMYRYLVLITKDGMYAAFLLSFLCLSMRFLVRRGAVTRGYVALWCLVGILTSLFRREGLYIIVPLLVCLAAYRGCRAKAAVAAVCIICAAQLWGAVALPLMKVKPASGRVVFSVPFQQTVRYLIEYPDDLSDDERAAIAEVFSLEGITEAYNPSLADPVLLRYHSDCTRDEMKDYLVVWSRLFLRHPDAYAHALFNNKYQYFYPSKKSTGQYGTATSVKIMGVANESAKAQFSVSPRSVEILKRLDEVRTGVFAWPLLNYVTTSYLYVLATVFLFFYAMRNHARNSWVILVAAFVHLVVLMAGPTNGYYFRYTYTLAMCLPVYLFAALPAAEPSSWQAAERDEESAVQDDGASVATETPRQLVLPEDDA